jgi:hypothetical protein
MRVEDPSFVFELKVDSIEESTLLARVVGSAPYLSASASMLTRPHSGPKLEKARAPGSG